MQFWQTCQNLPHGANIFITRTGRLTSFSHFLHSLKITPFTLKFEQHGYGAFKIKIQTTLLFIFRTACKEDNNKHHYVVV